MLESFLVFFICTTILFAILFAFELNMNHKLMWHSEELLYKVVTSSIDDDDDEDYDDPDFPEGEDTWKYELFKKG